MSSRTSAFRGLALVALSALGFAACENKAAPQPVQPVPPTLAATPAGPVTLTAVGQSVTIVASTTGYVGTPTVGFVSSTPAVATVNATTGVVTAVANGTTTITVTTTGVDNTGATVVLRAAVQIIVTIGPITPPGNATVSIASITNNAGQAVDVTNVQGQINIALNVDVPAGTQISRVETLINGVVVCSQAFTTGSVDAGVSPEGAEAAVTIVCPVNTAAFNATTNVPLTPNGQATISARLIGPTGTTVATASQQLTLNNNNFINATVVTSRGTATGGTNPGPGNLAPAGDLWSAGDVTFTLNPVIYNGSANALASATVSLSTSGAGVNGNAGCQPTFILATDPTIATAQGGFGLAGANAGATPNCAVATAAQTTTTVGTNGTMTVVFPEANVMNSTATGGNGVKGVEDLMNIVVTSVTTAGQPGPLCVNPNPATNPQNPTVIGAGIVTCGNGFAINTATGNPFTGNRLRLDNLAPRITKFDITPATLLCTPNASCYINSPAQINPGTTGALFASVDYGVDTQTASFFFGTAGTTALPASFGTADETATSSTDVAAVQVKDKLNNASASRFASTTPGNTVSTATSAGVQTFGIDITAPTCAFVNESTTAGTTPVNANELNPDPTTNQFALSFSDSATPPAGPSGFPTLPVTRIELGQTATTSVCIIGTGTAPACVGVKSAGTAAPVAGAQFADQFDGGVATQQYVTYTPTVRDVAGNVCTPTNGGATYTGSTTGQRTAIYDVTAPAVGGVVSPSTIAGNQSVTFSATASDNLDLGLATPSETYGAVITRLLFPTVTLGTFGPDVFTTSATVNFTDPAFIRSVETTAAGRPSGAVQQATGVSLAVADVARPAVATTTNQDITANVAAGSPSGFPSMVAAGKPFDPATNATGTFTSTASNLTVCNNSTITTACTNPTSTVLTASATGPASVFNNPFSRVNFYYTTAAGNTTLIGQGTVSVTDNTITSTRTWAYTITWTPSTLTDGVAPGTPYNVFAIGVDATGSGLQSNTTVVTIQNP
jgi:hypothetical protein